jgi:hypothetical protein
MFMFAMAALNIAFAVLVDMPALTWACWFTAGVLIGMEMMDRLNRRAIDTYQGETGE